ncbi:thiamine pyrophosphate-binding protein [Paracoccus litorisediminis]|uniref:Thiamine pyrophosphate-binding protein n=1 Tax=Paracoccus litorisediminis TaxID=2006130 RepID=A0A844HU84_9RHOB|nr:thiamine pyrophosphate-binding protein [Paracoccus litorisediminis]MTH62014.1 thiamine pyrophosphate-binding protein [Paracoccus litorisediminis]
MKDTPKSICVSAAPADVEQPLRQETFDAIFGSDLMAEAIKALDIPYVALNPGASYRGLHDSLVNYLGNEGPQMLLCLHEEHAVAIAHGWAKVTGRAMAAVAHSNVGLMHATMAVFNAWCDRMPLILLGATGPVDAAKRRPWIEWIHTARDQGALVRDYVKWDDQPGSALAARESILRADWISNMAPKGPVYVNLDAGLQEAELPALPSAIDAGRYRPAVSSGADAVELARIAEVLLQARKPVILAGRASRDPEAWNRRIALAERLGAKVLTDLKIGASFPTDHPLHAGAPGIYAVPEARAAVAEADVILSLDWVDLGGMLDAAFQGAPVTATVIQISLDHNLHRGWSMDYQALPVVDIMLAADPDQALPGLCGALGIGDSLPATYLPKALADYPELGEEPILMGHLAHALARATQGYDVSFVHLPLGWDGALWHFRHPLDFLGSDGGGGIGGGPGIAVGAALALKDTGRLPVCVGGDGDFLMGVTAIWTAVHYRIPLLYLVGNNQSFFNDEVHQERVARMRGRPVENKWIGMRMDDPEIDVAGIARAQGALGLGPVKSADALEAVLREALAHVEAGGVAVVDIRVEPGYTPAMVASLNRHAGEKK